MAFEFYFEMENFRKVFGRVVMWSILCSKWSLGPCYEKQIFRLEAGDQWEGCCIIHMRSKSGSEQNGSIMSAGIMSKADNIYWWVGQGVLEDKRSPITYGLSNGTNWGKFCEKSRFGCLGEIKGYSSSPAKSKMPSSHVSAEVEQVVGSKSLEFRGKVFLLERIRRQEESLEFEKCGKIKFILSHVLSCFKASVLLLPPWGVLLAFLISPPTFPSVSPMPWLLIISGLRKAVMILPSKCPPL